MKVYVLVCEDTIIGVYSSMKRAEDFVQRFRTSGKPFAEIYSFSVCERELDKDKEV